MNQDEHDHQDREGDGAEDLEVAVPVTVPLLLDLVVLALVGVDGQRRDDCGGAGVLSGVDHGCGVYEPADLVVLGCFVREGWVLLALELAGIVVVAIWAFRVALRMLVVCVDGLVDAVHDLRDLARGLRRGGRVIFKPRLKACAALYAEDLALLQGGAALGAILE